MIDSDRRPLPTSASTDVIISNHGPILGYSQIGVLSKLSIGPFTRSKFAIKNNCNDSLVFLMWFLFCGRGLCVFFKHVPILNKTKSEIETGKDSFPTH